MDPSKRKIQKSQRDDQSGENLSLARAAEEPPEQVLTSSVTPNATNRNGFLEQDTKVRENYAKNMLQSPGAISSNSRAYRPSTLKAARDRRLESNSDHSDEDDESDEFRRSSDASTISALTNPTFVTSSTNFASASSRLPLPRGPDPTTSNSTQQLPGLPARSNTSYSNSGAGSEPGAFPQHPSDSRNSVAENVTPDTDTPSNRSELVREPAMLPAAVSARLVEEEHDLEQRLRREMEEKFQDMARIAAQSGVYSNNPIYPQVPLQEAQVVQAEPVKPPPPLTESSSSTKGRWKKWCIILCAVFSVAGIGVGVGLALGGSGDNTSSEESSLEKEGTTSVPSLQNLPSKVPVQRPSQSPTLMGEPAATSRLPSASPTISVSLESPSSIAEASVAPTLSPTSIPLELQTDSPTMATTNRPTQQPTRQPTRQPTKRPTKLPSNSPSNSPTTRPTDSPTNKPTPEPMSLPTGAPTLPPSQIAAIQEERLRRLLEALAPISDIEDLEDPNSDQNRAARFLVQNLDPNLILEDIDQRRIIETYIMVLFYFATNGEQWLDSRNFLTGPDICQWNDPSLGEGVFCNSNGYVSDLLLYANNLDGTLVSELGLLTNLERLFLTENSDLRGPLPTGFSRLQSLIELGIYNNSLSGSIPSTFGRLRSLQYLSLAENLLVGRIPSSGILQNGLISVDLSLNSGLFGDLGPILDSLPDSLKEFQCGGCDFSLSSGNAQWERFSALEVLDLSSTGVSGEIPPEVGLMQNLIFFAVGSNNLSGRIPTEFSSLTNLKHFDVYDNFFTGDTPLLRSNSLDYFDVESNFLRGFVSDILLSLPQTTLQQFFIANNEISGSMPEEIGSYSSVTDFVVSLNFITGTIPNSITQMGSLVVLSIAGNELTGTVPDGISRLSNLITLQLHDNFFVDDLNDVFCSGNIPVLTADCERPDEVSCGCCRCFDTVIGEFV